VDRGEALPLQLNRDQSLDNPLFSLEFLVRISLPRAGQVRHTLLDERVIGELEAIDFSDKCIIVLETLLERILFAPHLFDLLWPELSIFPLVRSQVIVKHVKGGLLPWREVASVGSVPGFDALLQPRRRRSAMANFEGLDKSISRHMLPQAVH
jgi:hypothetical protein